jgi:hypothetical protein
MISIIPWTKELMSFMLMGLVMRALLLLIPSSSSSLLKQGARQIQPCVYYSQSSVSPTSTDDSIKKSGRTNYSPTHVRILDEVYQDTPYPDPEKVEELAQQLDIPETRIKVWFQNKRARWRRQVKDRAPMYPVMSPVVSPVAGTVAPYGLVAAVPTFAPYSPASQVFPGHYQPYPNSPVSFYTPGHHHQFYQSPQILQEQSKQPVALQSGDQRRRHSPSQSPPSSPKTDSPPSIPHPVWLSAPFSQHFSPFPYGAYSPYYGRSRC